MRIDPKNLKNWTHENAIHLINQIVETTWHFCQGLLESSSPESSDLPVAREDVQALVDLGKVPFGQRQETAGTFTDYVLKALRLFFDDPVDLCSRLFGEIEATEEDPNQPLVLIKDMIHEMKAAANR